MSLYNHTIHYNIKGTPNSEKLNSFDVRYISISNVVFVLAPNKMSKYRV